jgi:phage protein D
MNMMTVSTDFMAMASKYNNFRAPTLEITVEGTQLIAGSKVNVTDASVNLNIDGNATTCSFTVVGEYKAKKTDFTGDIAPIQVGAKVQIDMGYIKTEKVFSGYINSVTYDFNSGSGYSVRVDGQDAIGLMQKPLQMEVNKEESAKKLVERFLGKAPMCSYLDGKEIDISEDEKIENTDSPVSDFELIQQHATKQGYDFFVIQGKFYFRKKEKDKSVSIKLSPKHGIYDASLALSGQALFKTAAVNAMDKTGDKEIKVEENIKGKFSQGSTAERMMGPSKQVFQEAKVENEAAAKTKATEHLEKAKEDFGKLSVSCIGIPEIGPGRFIQLEELSGILNTKYYATSVTHSMGGDGYKTQIEARLRSL